MENQGIENKDIYAKSVGEISLQEQKEKKTESLKEQALKMIAEGFLISAVSRILNISLWTISTWIQREGKRLLKEHEKKSKNFCKKV